MEFNSQKNASILIVDDESANCLLLEKILGCEGYSNLVSVQDSRDVIDIYKTRRADLILLDLNMPYMDGYQVIKALQDLNDPLLPPIIVLTAQHSKEHLHHALKLGGRDFITKPFDRVELLMRVRNLLAAQLAHCMLYEQKAVLVEMVEERTKELHSSRLDVVQRLGMAAEYRDEETGNHILRMSHICALLARSMGWSESKCDLILNASPMHDIGKIGIPDAILLKPGKLDPAEWEIMKSHVTIGAKLLESNNESELLNMARDIALTHHEKWDGSGYPNGLIGEQIPQAGRIAAIADVFDALTSERPYKKAWDVEDANDLIRQNSGKHFDPQIVEVFFKELPNILNIRDRYSD